MQVHESVGHPTELDRVYGTEAAYAGTSFLSAGDLGSLRYGSQKMNVTSDATTPLGLGTFGFDDEGVPAQREAIVEEGVLRGFLTSRETAARIGTGVGGCMRADGWSRMPLVRMTNLHLEPGEGSFEDLLADVDDGLYMETNKSWSIDDKRLNFQFGTQIAWEIKNGKLGRMLRDATYTGVTRCSGGSSMPWLGRTSGSSSASRTAARDSPGRKPTCCTARRRRGSGACRSASRHEPGSDLAEQALRSAEGDEAEVLVHAERSGVARFAASVVHQPTLIDNAVLRVRVLRDGKIGWAATNRGDADSLAEVARRAGDAADSARPDPDFPGLAPPADYQDVGGYDEETA